MSAVLNPPVGPSPREAAREWLPVVLGLLALYAPTFYALATSLWQEDDYAHGPIVLAVIVWLIWDRRSVLLAPPTSGLAQKSGFALLGFGLLTYFVGRGYGVTILDVGSLVPVLAGLLLVMRGWPALRSYWFVLLFVAYLLPLPGIFVDAVTGPLKQQVSEFAEQILYMAGYPIARTGVMLTIGQYDLLVADACSGINSMFSLSAVGLFYLYLTGRKGWIHNGLIVASLLPIAFCANIVRVIFLVLVTYYYGDEAGQGYLHNLSGLVLFVISLLLVLVIDQALARIIRPAKAA